MQFEWLEQANEKALSAAIPLHFKQYGHPKNNPLMQRYLDRGYKIRAAWKAIVEAGLELAPQEKGGAAYKGRVYHEKPLHWHALKAQLNIQAPCKRAAD
jgi:hypothetical protein